MSQSHTGPIVNSSISVKPSQNLRDFISKIKITNDLPLGISNIVYKHKVKNVNKSPSPKICQLINEEDEIFIKTITRDVDKDIFTQLPLNKASTVTDTDKLLSLEDLHWLHNYIQKQNQNNDDKIWLHELMEGSEVILPKNEKIPRNEELDKRCKRLKEEQANRDYFKMTKNVDNKRRVLPEDTVGYQCKCE